MMESYKKEDGMKFGFLLFCFFLTGCYQAFSGSEDEISTRPTTNDLNMFSSGSASPL